MYGLGSSPPLPPRLFSSYLDYTNSLDRCLGLKYYSPMALFDIAIRLTLQHEGGYVDNLNDPGGATKYGITQADLPGTNIAELTSAQASVYYLANYWKPLYNQIASQDVANKLFDFGVLFGVRTAAKALQVVLGIPLDGLFGPMTLFAVNEANSVTLLAAYKQQMVARALAIANANPNERIFLTGWLRRIAS